jgi:response regulator RpfG family c-di-GMP phosphodiesterase
MAAATRMGCAAIVDVFDALTTERAYKPAYSIERGIDELTAEAYCGWRRPDLVKEFLALCEGRSLFDGEAV